MKINEQWEMLKVESHANIQSKKGILKRQIRSIQAEGHFGDIKENENFRRFLQKISRLSIHFLRKSFDNRFTPNLLNLS